MKLASLALAWMKQDREFRVRQREELRRALAETAEFRGWAIPGADPVAAAIKDVKTLTKAGSQFIAEELEVELAEKNAEVTELKVVAESIHELADTADWEEPVEVSYSHTARNGEGLATKMQTVTLADAGEARDAAAAIEKRLDTWEKLRIQMLEVLKQKQVQLGEMEDSISAFAESSKGVVGDVLAILH